MVRIVMPVIVVSVPAGCGLRGKRALLLVRGFKDETENARADNKYCRKNGYLHRMDPPGAEVSHAMCFEERTQ
jgi:hypothetical protein